MLLTLVLCVICPVVLSSDVQTVLPDNYDTKPIDGDEYGVRNYVSDHELPRDVPTRVKIVGDLGTPPPSVKLDFVPQQTYVQVRRYDAVKRLPQEAAMEEAATSEEVLNAPRLREVVTHKKTQEVYEEQGYEDAGYDHGGSKKHKIEEEVKDNQSVEVLGPGPAQNGEETKDSVASIAPSGRGSWSRHKTTTGQKTKYEEDGNTRKVTINDSNPVSEKSSGNYTKFDGGKTIIVQNVTEQVKKDGKNEGAESRRVPSFSKNASDNIEPTTYRPTVRHDSSRVSTKQTRNEQKRNRTRNRPRKQPETNVQKSNTQADVIGSYDNSPWIPISRPTETEEQPQSVSKKHVKSKINSELHEPNGHTAKYGYSVNHDTPYQYVYPSEIIAHRPPNKSNFKFKTKNENTNTFDGKPKGTSYGSHEYAPQTNYDGSAINSKKKRVKSTENISFDQIDVPSNTKYKEPTTQLKTELPRNTKHDRGTSNQRPKNKPVQSESSEYFDSDLKLPPPREQKKKKGHRGVETELGNQENIDSRYTNSMVQDLSPPKLYDAHFITSRPKKNNYNIDSSGDHTIRVVYPKYEFYPNYQNFKHSIKDEFQHSQRPLSNQNKGYENFELTEQPPRNTKRERQRLSEYSKFNNRPKNVHKESTESIESWENYPKIRDQIPQLTEESYSTFRKGENYPRFESNQRFEITGSRSSPIYRLVPYKKSVKINNPYSYVYHDDHYPSGSRYSGVKVEATTLNPKSSDRVVYWNNRHPHLPKDSIKNTPDEHKGRDKSYDDNTRHVENLTLAHFSGYHKAGSNRPLPLEYNERVNNLAKLLNDNYPRRTRRDLEVIHIASSGTTTEIPVDTVVYPHYKKAPKPSALRYATNPNLKPRKTAGGMEFYASTDNVQCDDMSVPDDIVPERTEDGEWKGESSNKSPRVDALGDKIGCLKKKFFGSDPLDNPIFKEKDVGFPEVLFATRRPAKKKEDSIQPGKPHVDWNFADELIPSQWFPDKDKRKRRSDNSSLPMNHKVQGMASIIPEPVILTFPTKTSMVVYTNDTKSDVEDNDSEVSSNDEHILKFSVKHPVPKPSETNIQKPHSIDTKIVGLVPPPQTTKVIKKQHIVKKPTMKKILKKVKVNDDELNEADLLDVLSPITSFFTDEDDAIAAPIVHNFFNIKMEPSAKLKTMTTVDKNSGERVNRYYRQNFKRTKRNMKGIDLQKPRQRKLETSTSTNVTLSSPTARVRMYTPKNGSWFRNKRDHIAVNVDVKRKEPRYYYHAEQPRVRVKRVVHNPPFYSRSGHVFSSKYLTSDQENAETLPEEINVAFSTTTSKYDFIPKLTLTPKYPQTPKYIPLSTPTSTSATPKFISAIAFGDSKTKVINYNDSVANSTNDVERGQLDKKGSLIYVINPDTGLGKWMQVIKVKNEEDTKFALTNGPVYLEKKVKDGLAAEDTIGKFGFKGSNKELFKNVLGPTFDHRFRFPSKESIRDEVKEKSKKTDCPKTIRPRKKEIKRRTTTTTTEIPVVEDVDDKPEEQSGEDDNAGPQEEGEEGENEEEQPTERPQYQQESEENPENTEDQDQDQDQDIHESYRKKPYAMVKKPEFNGYFFGSRDKNKRTV